MAASADEVERADLLTRIRTSTAAAPGSVPATILIFLVAAVVFLALIGNGARVNTTARAPARILKKAVVAVTKESRKKRGGRRKIKYGSLAKADEDLEDGELDDNEEPDEPPMPMTTRL